MLTPFDAAAILIVLAAVLAPVQAFVGDQHGLNTLEHQPAKIAAIEAIWKTEKGAPLVLFAIPNEKERRNDFAIEIPKGASLILKYDPNAELKGMDAFAPNAPPVTPVFFAFRVMVGMGVLMIALSWLGAWMMRKDAVPPRWLLWTFGGFTFSGKGMYSLSSPGMRGKRAEPGPPAQSAFARAMFSAVSPI